MRPRSIVFDLFGDYLRYRGGEAPLLALVRLLSAFGIGESASRVALARLRRDGWFEARSVGRQTIYALTDRSWNMLDEGRSRIFQRGADSWDGQWRMVIYEVPEAERGVRDEVRKELIWLGFGPFATSTWISPHNHLATVAERFADQRGVRMDLLTCRSSGAQHDREMAARCWDLDTLNRDYARFLSTYGARLPEFRTATITPERALVTRTELTHAYRKFPFRDPDLPSELLPAGWRGHDAHQLFITAHDLLGPAAERYIDGLLTSGHATETV